MISLKTNCGVAPDLCDEIRIFSDEKLIPVVNALTENCVAHEFIPGDKWINKTEFYLDGKKVSEYIYESDSYDIANGLIYKKMLKRAAKISVFRALNRHYKKDMPWGSLTGIRPTKLMRELQGQTDIFSEQFDVRADKIELARAIVCRQQPIIDSLQPQDIDVYIGIPFCMSRCAYCSFASSLKDKALEDAYIDALLLQARLCAPILKDRNIRAIYVGGGTPTALEDYNLHKVLSMAKDLGAAIEFTVEAGRPDSITQSKLDIIKNAGAGRISVNAQTTCQATLDLIGRGHTHRQFIEAFELGRRSGFAINTDIIIGLPGEDESTAHQTIKDVVSMHPENITVHTLAIKRASEFASKHRDIFPDGQTAQGMLDVCSKALQQNSYMPYYMYRQKYMRGNLENVGYTQAGGECIYNIDIMEETADILALGAGGISKRVFEGENRIERAPVVKDILHFISRTEEMAQRKIHLFNAK